MSRIGKHPIKLDENIEITINNNNIKIKGPKGQLEHIIPENITVRHTKNRLTIATLNDNRITKKLHGLYRTIINNMVIGVSQGFHKTLEIHGVGYRAQIEKEKKLILNVGYSHPVEIIAPEEISLKVDEQTIITVQGINKAIVGQISSQIRAIRPPEPYKGKGIRYKNEVIKKKVGKAGK
uniref:Large ribosomal subunit protein uL6c n=1 Tax=Porolithon onkodes TaxID=231751 RepID=A0A2Z2KXK7_9FLOR|nr:50S ribosomal protein L6 [Porolithon onkodes]ASB29705.1 50S ribosomal protein L6 [Porolithon onkodes]